MTTPPSPSHEALPWREPADLYEACRAPGAMLLESARGPMRIARYSFIAMEPYLEYRVKDGHASITGPLADESGILRPGEHPLRTLKRLLAAHPQTPDPALPPFQGGCAGMFSYEFVHYLERIPRTPVDDLGVPDAHIYFHDRVYAFDHQERTLHAIVQPGVRPGHAEALARMSETARGLTPTPWEHPGGPGGAGGSGAIVIDHDTPEERYTEMVRRAKEYIAAGDIFQANLSLRVSASLQGRSPWALYRTLGRINPSPFACYLDMGEYVSGLVARASRECAGPRGGDPPDRGHAPARRGRGRGRSHAAGTPTEREGAGRTHHAHRP